MRAPKLLCVASAVDLDFRYGCTPAWWQLWRGLNDEGAELVVAPYRGRPIETPWWRSAPNPTYAEGEAYARARGAFARLKGDKHLRREEDSPDDSLGDRLTREAIWSLVTPRWRRHLERLIEHERPDAVVVFTVPMAHFRGIPEALRERFDLPVVFYDGDVPMSLPEFGGMDTGFNYYHGADPGEYDLVISNSEGALDTLLGLGARRAEAIFWGADPDFFAPQPVEKETDVFFYGYGDKFRREWMSAFVGEPSRELTDIDFALGGHDFLGDTGLARRIGDIPFPSFPRAISAARINLCLTRRPHATRVRVVLVPAVRARLGRRGDRREPLRRDRALVRAGLGADRSPPTPARRSRPTARCSTIPAQAEEMGRRARERVLDEHTYRHRARRLLDLLDLNVKAHVD